MSFIRIIYGAPPSNNPSGGVKVIYQHSELLNNIGIYSAIWHPSDEDFQCSWFSNNINKIKFSDLSPKTDFVILPELWASSYVTLLKEAGFKVGIYVQNCYLTHVNLNKNNINAILEAYAEADLILSISKDTSEYLIDILHVPQDKITLQRYSINHNIFSPKNKKLLISYMPRKMSDHSVRVVHSLSNIINKNWIIQPIDNKTELEVAQILSHSIIFLAFSEFEGLPVPPVEAALCGNYVIGYHGQGGKEYWNLPNFLPVEQGNIQEFVKITLETIRFIESSSIDINSLNDGIMKLANYFSKDTELILINNLVNKVSQLYLK
jgi:hypothetical protein